MSKFRRTGVRAKPRSVGSSTTSPRPQHSIRSRVVLFPLLAVVSTALIGRPSLPLPRRPDVGGLGLPAVFGFDLCLGPGHGADRNRTQLGLVDGWSPYPNTGAPACCPVGPFAAQLLVDGGVCVPGWTTYLVHRLDPRRCGRRRPDSAPAAVYGRSRRRADRRPRPAGRVWQSPAAGSGSSTSVLATPSLAASLPGGLSPFRPPVRS